MTSTTPSRYHHDQPTGRGAGRRRFRPRVHLREPRGQAGAFPPDGGARRPGRHPGDEHVGHPDLRDRRGLAAAGPVVGAHWWNPPYLMPIVEIIPGEKTTQETVDRATKLMAAAGKIPVQRQEGRSRVRRQPPASRALPRGDVHRRARDRRSGRRRPGAQVRAGHALPGDGALRAPGHGGHRPGHRRGELPVAAPGRLPRGVPDDRPRRWPRGSWASRPTGSASAPGRPRSRRPSASACWTTWSGRWPRELWESPKAHPKNTDRFRRRACSPDARRYTA